MRQGENCSEERTLPQAAALQGQVLLPRLSMAIVPARNILLQWHRARPELQGLSRDQLWPFLLYSKAMQILSSNRGGVQLLMEKAFPPGSSSTGKLE